MLNIRRIPISALAGILVTLLFVLAAIFTPWIAPYPDAAIVGDVWAPASAAHWLGTDNLGRDILSRLIYGARITLFIAFLATVPSFTLGASLGFSAAVVGGWFDELLSRFVDLIMSEVPRPARARGDDADADPRHGRPRFHARLPHFPGRRRRHKRHGLRRGGQVARRGEALDHLP